VDDGAGTQGYGSSGRSRWQDNQPQQGNNDGSRPWVDRRPPGKGTPRLQPPSSGWSPRQGGPQSGGQWMPGQGGLRSRPPAQGNAGNLRPGWRSPSGDRGGQPSVQQQYPPGQRRWNQCRTSKGGSRRVSDSGRLPRSEFACGSCRCCCSSFCCGQHFS